VQKKGSGCGAYELQSAEGVRERRGGGRERRKGTYVGNGKKGEESGGEGKTGNML
jgi:hypothetical protein